MLLTSLSPPHLLLGAWYAQGHDGIGLSLFGREISVKWKEREKASDMKNIKYILFSASVSFARSSARVVHWTAERALSEPPSLCATSAELRSREPSSSGNAALISAGSSSGKKGCTSRYLIASVKDCTNTGKTRG